jgi:hypothetical protein
MGANQVPAPSASFAYNSPPASWAVPAGLTLRYTYTTSQTGQTFAASPVYAVVVGGGGGGHSNNGGGGGAVVSGWVYPTSVVTVGASAAQNTFGNYSMFGGLFAPGGGSTSNNFWGLVSGGAGAGGNPGSNGDFLPVPYINAVGGGGSVSAYSGSYSFGVSAKSGGGGYIAGAGGNGFVGGGGGSSAVGGNGLFAGGGGSGGGGGGYLGAGASGSGTTGGAGGSGGGGGGQGTTGGAGGNGCVLVYY